MKIVTLSPKQFDKFAKNHRYRNYYQTSAYGNTMIKFGYNVHYLGMVNEQNKLIIFFFFFISCIILLESNTIAFIIPPHI